MDETRLRKIAHEAWQNAATIDGLMRYLGPLIEEIQVTSWRDGYNRGRREGEEAQQDHPQGNTDGEVPE